MKYTGFERLLLIVGGVTVFASITAVFLYTSVTNMIERPEGLKIALVFIVTTSSVSKPPSTFRTTWVRETCLLSTFCPSGSVAATRRQAVQCG